MKIDETMSFLRKEKREMLQRKLVTLKKELPTLSYVILFGSYARGEEKATSDLDLLLLTAEPVERLVRGGLCSSFEEENIDLVFYTTEQFRESECLLVQQVNKEGIIIWKQS